MGVDRLEARLFNRAGNRFRSDAEHDRLARMRAELREPCRWNRKPASVFQHNRQSIADRLERCAEEVHRR